MTANPFPRSLYEPLDNLAQEVRLLNFKKSHTLDSSIWSTDFTLETFKLADTPPFHALSYTWGTSPNSGSICVNQELIPVGANLLAALEHLQRGSCVLPLWVDAICINQSDKDEKSHQVPLMSQIYSQAQLVHVWLGPETDLTTRAFTFLEECSSSAKYILSARESGKLDGTLSPSRLPPKYEEYVLTKVQQFSTEEYQFAVKQLFENPYWFRVWVLQEVAHAGDAIIHGGSHSCTITDLLLASTFWDTAHLVSIDTNGTSIFGLTFGHFYIFRRIILGFAGHSIQSPKNLNLLSANEGDYFKSFFPIHLDLLSLFTDTRQFKATDLRDKFFALLNLLQPAQRFIVPNYHLDEATLYRNIIKQAIQHSDSLGCLDIGGIGLFPTRSAFNHPSWIPDFQKIGCGQLPYSNPVSRLYESCRTTSPNASLSQSPEYSFFFSQGNENLSAMGFFCDKIIKVVPFTDVYDTFQDIAQLLKTYEVRAGEGTRIYGKLFQTIFPPVLFNDMQASIGDINPGAIEENLTTIASGFMLRLGLASMELYFNEKLDKQNYLREMESSPPLSAQEELFMFFSEGDPALAYFSLGISSDQNLLEPGPIHEKIYTQVAKAFGDETANQYSCPQGMISRYPNNNTGQDSTAEAAIGRFTSMFTHLWSDRAFFTTEGGFMGFARPGTLVDDQLCILHGCPVPLVSRRDGNAHLLVGDCHIDGMMHGEMVDRQQQGEFVIQNIDFK